jgi:glycoprotein 6-alpha-L-fucosyltransferase
VIALEGNQWNGFSKGRNQRTNQIGLYPSYKAKEKFTIVDYPTYPHVKL